MYTPPATKLKSDLGLELRKIKEEINAEISRKEVVVREREQAEYGFSAREKKIKDMEQSWIEKLHVLKQEEMKLISIIDVKSKKISEKTSEMVHIDNAISKYTSTLKEFSDLAMEEEKRLSKDLEDKKLLIAKIDEIILQKQECVSFYSLHLSWIGNQIRKMSKKLSELMDEYNQKNSNLEDRERKVVILEKDTAIMSTQLIKKYHIYEPETRIEKLLSL